MINRTIEVSEETYNAIKDQLTTEERIDLSKLDDMIGNCFFFRTVTYHLVGRVTKLIGKDLMELEDASWVAYSGRFMDAIKDGTLKEVEPVGIAYINLQTVTDFFPWSHDLPKDQI